MALIIILGILWVMGYLRIPGFLFPHIVLFNLFGHAVTLLEFVVFIVILLVMETLPSPFRQVAYVLVVLWVLSIFGLIAVAGFSQLMVLALIIGLILALLQKG